MPHFKDQVERLYFLSDADIEAGGLGLLPPSSMQINDAEADAIRASVLFDASSVPQVVTRRQALLALLAVGKLDQVEQAVQNAPRAVQIAWQACGTFERSNPLIEALAPQVGLSEADIDNLFTEAAKL